MKVFVVLVLVVLVPAASVHADTFLKINEHTDSYYRGGVVNPAEDSENEIWYGNGKISMTEEDRRFVVDIEAKKLIVIELANNVYIETDMPINLIQIVPEQYIQRIMMFPTVGEVEKLNDTKEIEGRKCQAYQFDSWVMYQGNRYNETETTLWVTTDPPFDNELTGAITEVFSKLQNYSEELITEMKKIEGFSLLSENVRYVEGLAIKSYTKVIEIDEKDPPEGIYSIPEGFEKQERLTPRE